jgi:DHA1 family tetracycline resistance protein-like MFS transporter
VKGRKFVFVLAFAVCALELLLLTFYPSIQMIFLTRAMSGLGDAGVAAAYAMVTDIAMHNQDIVAQQYGLLGAMTGLAFIVGPYLGGRLMEIDMDLCFFVAAIIAITGGVLSFIFLEETKPMLEEAETHGIVGQDCGDEQIHDKDRQLTEQSTPSNRCSLCINFNPLEGLKSHLNNPSLRVLLVPLALSAVNLGIPFIWYMYMHHTFHATASQIGLFLSFHGLMNAIAQGLFIRVVIPRFLTERNAAVYGLLVVALHTVCYGLCQETWQLFAVALIFCLSIIHYPALKAIVVCESLECRNEVQFQANLQGAISSIRTASIACGSILYTSLFSYGISLEPMPLQQLPFLVAGAIYVTAFFALASALRTIDRRRSEQQHHVGNGHRSASYDERRTSSPTTTLSPNTLYQRIAQKSGGTVSSSESLTATSVSLIANNNVRLSSYQRSQGEYELVQLNPAHHQ